MVLMVAVAAVVRFLDLVVAQEPQTKEKTEEAGGALRRQDRAVVVVEPTQSV
jgi:hypothetical protein